MTTQTVPLSNSPLCPHIQVGAGLEWLATLKVLPKAVKVFAPAQAKALKALNPNIVTVLRRYVSNQEAYLNEGYVGGMRFVVEAGDLTGVDYFGGLNELMNSADNIRKLVEFDLGMIAALSRQGVHPLSSSIAQGNPPNEADIAAYTEAANIIRLLDGAMDYHGYGGFPLLTGEEWHLNRGPMRLARYLPPVSWVYGEFGFDDLGHSNWPNARGYKQLLKRLKDSSITQIQAEYEMAARRLQQLGVRFAFVFNFFGTSEWADFEHADNPEMLAWFADHWERWAETQQPPKRPPRAQVYRTGGRGVRVRIAPRTTATVLGVLEDGVWLEDIEVVDRWVKIPLTLVQAAGVNLKPSSAGKAYGYIPLRYARVEGG